MGRGKSHFGAILGVLSVFLPLGSATEVGAQVESVSLASHRAIYELKLGETRGKRALAAVRGLIVYDFSGSECEGYVLQFRQVTELDNGEGRVAISDLRSTTWEEGSAKAYRFNFQNFLNDNLIETVDGRAQRQPDAVKVSLSRPAEKQLDLNANVAFPTEQIRQIIVAARREQPLLELSVYDGSETGEKLYNTLTVIGRSIPREERKPTDAAADNPVMTDLKRWPVTISYFEKSQAGGEQTPAYSITFELFENGISRSLALDYGDFVVSGELKTLEVRESKPCR
jgi:hypothetical protein